jgi:putative RecB family exonuclease
MQCPLLYRFRVIDKLPSPPHPAAARGTLVHAVLERLFDLPSAARTIEAAAALVEPQWRELLEDRPELADLVQESDPAALAGWFGDAVSLLERWFTLEDPTKLEPAERELRVEVDVDGLTLRGIVDRLDLTPTGEMRVVDYKTGKAPLAQFESKALFQMKFYALVLWRLRGQVPRMLQLVYLGGDEPVIVRYCPDEADLQAVERKLKALWHAIEAAARSGDWRPNKTRLCDWCDHRSLCPAWGGTPPPLPEGSAVLALDPNAMAAVVAADD